MDSDRREREHLTTAIRQELEARGEIMFAYLHGSFLAGESYRDIDNDAPLAFLYHALTGRRLVVRDANFLDEIRARTWDEYFDFLPFARQYLREALPE